MSIPLWSSYLRERREINNKETHNSFPDMVCERERKRGGQRERHTERQSLREIERQKETKRKTQKE